MATVTFDGLNKIIAVNAAITAIDAKTNLYSEWKAWANAGNAQWPAAFRVVGGDPLGGAVSAGSYFFLQNQSGWRIRPDTNLNITGNLYPEDLAQPVFIPALGTGTFTIQTSLSSLTQTANTGGGSGLTASQASQLQSVFDITGGGGNQVGTQLIMYAADNATEVARFNLYDAAGVLTSDMSKVVRQDRV